MKGKPVDQSRERGTINEFLHEQNGLFSSRAKETLLLEFHGRKQKSGSASWRGHAFEFREEGKGELVSPGERTREVLRARG